MEDNIEDNIEAGIARELAKAEVIHDRLAKAFDSIMADGSWSPMAVLMGVQSFAAAGTAFTLHHMEGTAADLEVVLEEFAAQCRSMYLQRPPHADDQKGDGHGH